MIIRQINDVERLVEHSTQHDTIGSVMSTISVSSSRNIYEKLWFNWQYLIILQKCYTLWIKELINKFGKGSR